MLPLQVAGLRIERLQEPRRVDVVARPHQHVIPDHDGRRSREVALLQVGNRLVPALLAGLGIERDQVVVGRLHEQVAVPHRHAAIADVRAALGLPEVVPEFAPVDRVDRPGVIRHGDVQHAVHLEHRPLDRAAARWNVARPFAAHDQFRRPAAPESSAASAIARPGRQPCHPGQREMLDVRLVDLRQRTVTLAGVIAVVSRPGVFQRLE